MEKLTTKVRTPSPSSGIPLLLSVIVLVAVGFSWVAPDVSVTPPAVPGKWCRPIGRVDAVTGLVCLGLMRFDVTRGR